MKIIQSLCQKLNFIKSPNIQSRFITYKQGQEPVPNIREYFYYIDHQGMLFLDDSKMKNFTSCYKEKKFLEFFFKRVKLNTTGRYEDEFPFVSLCGRERNYIRCDDVPIVYTHLINNSSGIYFLTYGYAGDLLKTQFLPEKIYMSNTGRIYHPADDKYGGIGLIRSKLAIELSKHFKFNNGNNLSPTHFIWNNETYELDKNWFSDKIEKFNVKIKTDPD
ncbi:UPF0598 protein CG30010-like [Achroia grisella]|uniref:UPF0598 protein CG30010-like n=1 Tax=Achroia grisella TaxID=688607 RepID=UPI0027D24B00|nr:UPF0598 protein CG30010-like [Achroia grisella]